MKADAKWFLRLITILRRSATLLIFVLMFGFTVASHTVGMITDFVSNAILVTTGISTAAQSARTELRSARAEARAASIKVDALEADLELSRRQIGNLERQQRTLNVDLLNERAATASLRYNLVLTQNANMVSFNGQRISVREATAQTMETLQNRTRSVAAANLGSMLGESFPFYGIAVIVAATTYELTMACHSMRDMHDLQVALDPTYASPVDRDVVCGLQVPTKDELWEAIKRSPGAAWDQTLAVIEATPGFIATLPRPDFSGPWSRLMAWGGSRN